jgi:aminoglycoside/choline kinase family phosphotransferase
LTHEAAAELGLKRRRARSRLSRAALPDEGDARPRAGTHRFVESIIHEARASAPRTLASLPVTSPPSPHPIVWADPARESAFTAWLGRVAANHGLVVSSLRPASSDASFRRYLRVDAGAGSLIVMDAPPPREDVRPFVHIASLIASAGLHAPRVLEADAAQGFLLLDDLGSELYLGVLQAAQQRGDARRADVLMRDAIAALVAWQGRVANDTLPLYDEALLRRELALFPDWCVARECRSTWSQAEAATWRHACDLLVADALAQPQVTVHRDWMPRNLMVAEPNPGILDFQDAVRGPIAYDVASLLRDAFISWDEEQEIDWAIRYWEAARKAGLPVRADFGEFWRELEWIGLQRHLKVLGIFSRLKHRDGKPAYCEDLPRFFAYAHKVASRYSALRPLARLLEPLMGAQRIDVFR